MIPYIFFGVVVVAFIYNNYCLKYIILPNENNNDNKRIDEIIEKVGVENVINNLNTDETFKKSIKELD